MCPAFKQGRLRLSFHVFTLPETLDPFLGAFPAQPPGAKGNQGEPSAAGARQGGHVIAGGVQSSVLDAGKHDHSISLLVKTQHLLPLRTGSFIFRNDLAFMWV